MRRLVLTLLTCTITFSSFAQHPAAKRPNIIIILADDLGYSDPGCFGGEIRTPNLDWLATKGVRFSRFYNISRCCPSRASLLTGLYPQQAGIGNMTRDQHAPAYRGFLTENTVTLAEVLRSAGYRTAMVGKWHVSNTIEQPSSAEQLKWLDHQAEHPYFSPVEQYPVNRGFDRHYGTIWGVVDHFDPFSLVRDMSAVKSVPKDYYHTDALNDTAAAWIRGFAHAKKPFFLYLAHNAPHWPVQALPVDIAKYEHTYDAGWNAVRKARYSRMVKMGLVNPETQPLSPMNDSTADWDSNPDKHWDAHVMAVHAAMIDRMDQGIGRIIRALKESGQLDNTVIFFLSDNGASPEVAQAMGPGFDRPGETRDGRQIIYPRDKQAMAGPETVYASIGERWANVANTPYRYWKRESYEGGVRTPAIVFWPAGLKRKPGSIYSGLGHIMDFMPTLVDLAGASYPALFNGHAITPMQGVSMAPVLSGSASVADRVIFNEHVNGRSVRQGRWKLVKLFPDRPWELYNMEIDETELHNVALDHQDIVSRLAARWDEWAATNHVLPKPK